MTYERKRIWIVELELLWRLIRFRNVYTISGETRLAWNYCFKCCSSDIFRTPFCLSVQRRCPEGVGRVALQTVRMYCRYPWRTSSVELPSLVQHTRPPWFSSLESLLLKQWNLIVRHALRSLLHVQSWCCYFFKFPDQAAFELCET